MANTKLSDQIIVDLISSDSRVLDLSCNSTELTNLLADKKNVTAAGDKLREQALNSCINKNLAVYQKNIEESFADYADGYFNYVILQQIFNEYNNVNSILNEALRIGQNVIVGLSKASTNTVHNDKQKLFLDFSSFHNYCTEKGINIIKSFYHDDQKIINFLPNLFARYALFHLTKPEPTMVERLFKEGYHFETGEAA